MSLLLQGLSAHFQPIVECRTGRIVAYEALARGAGEYRSPARLFERAAELGTTPELERACWRAALGGSPGVRDEVRAGALLFINVLPETLLDPTFVRFVQTAVADAELPPEHIVAELHEGQRHVDIPQLARCLDAYRDLGLRFALDDAGAGHAGLYMLVECLPEFIKLDRSLIQNLPGDRARRSVVAATVRLAEQQGSTLVAEGIETADELRVVVELGVACGQGYFLARPAARPPAVEPAAATVLRGSRPAAQDARAGQDPRIRDLVRRASTIERERTVREALDLLSRGDEDVLVLVEEDRPVGLLPRSRLLEMLARPYGRELYLRKAVQEVAELELLVVEGDQELTEVSRLAMSRPERAIYDYITVVERGLLLGLVSVRRLLDAITDIRMEEARYANPLTGLPGNPAIEARLRSRLRESEAFSVLHADIDEFKAFNDACGVHRGDEAIRLTAEVLTRVIRRLPMPGTFLGHVGGDDFLAIVPAGLAGAVATEITDEFAASVGQLYSDVDRARGHGADASVPGVPQGSAPIGITVASVLVCPDADRHYAHVLDELAEAKRKAKAESKMRRRLQVVPTR